MLLRLEFFSLLRYWAAYVDNCLPTFRDIPFKHSRVRESNSVYFHEAALTEGILCCVSGSWVKIFGPPFFFKVTSPWILLRWLSWRWKPPLCLRRYLPLYQTPRHHNQEDHVFSNNHREDFDLPLHCLCNIGYWKEEKIRVKYRKIFIFILF